MKNMLNIAAGILAVGLTACAGPQMAETPPAETPPSEGKTFENMGPAEIEKVAREAVNILTNPGVDASEVKEDASSEEPKSILQVAVEKTLKSTLVDGLLQVDFIFDLETIDDQGKKEGIEKRLKEIFEKGEKLSNTGKDSVGYRLVNLQDIKDAERDISLLPTENVSTPAVRRDDNPIPLTFTKEERKYVLVTGTPTMDQKGECYTTYAYTYSVGGRATIGTAVDIYPEDVVTLDGVRTRDGAKHTIKVTPPDAEGNINIKALAEDVRGSIKEGGRCTTEPSDLVDIRDYDTYIMVWRGEPVVTAQYHKINVINQTAVPHASYTVGKPGCPPEKEWKGHPIGEGAVERFQNRLGNSC